MPQWSKAADLTTNNLPNLGGKGTQAYRPIAAAANYSPGTVLQLASVDNQLYPDFQTVQPSPAGTVVSKIVGVVDGSWPGFIGSVSGAPVYASAFNPAGLVRGTQFVTAAVKGIAYVNIDQSGAGASTITDGTGLVSSRNTAGAAQGVAAAANPGLIGAANLPASGIGSSIAAAALAQAAQTATVATPAAGDTLNLTLQAQYTDSAPGVLQTITYSLTLTAAQAASATTAAAAMVAYLQTFAGFNQYFTASNALGVITIAVNALQTPFLVTFGSGGVETGRYFISISGVVANSLTFACSKTGPGGTTFVAGGANFAAGAGYLGMIPALINGEF